MGIKYTNKVCAGVQENGAPCDRYLASHNKSGFCTEHRNQDLVRMAYKRKMSARPDARSRSNEYRRLKSHRRSLQVPVYFCKGVRDDGQKCTNQLGPQNHSGYCSLHHTQSSTALEWRKQYRKGKKEVKGDINVCLKDANRNDSGQYLCMYTGKPVKVGGKNSFDKAVAEHIDPMLKGLPIDKNADSVNWDERDGAHNWVLSRMDINSSKRSRCFFEWHLREKDFLGLRPLHAIMADMYRLGKRLPQPKVPVYELVKEQR